MDDPNNSNSSSSSNVESKSDAFVVCGALNADERKDEDDDDIGEYYFESDHLALRNNQDYRKLLKAVVVLQAQRTKALQDIDRLLEAKDAALADPIAFVEKLQRGELDLPKPQKVYKVPIIDWSKYAINGRTPSFSHHHMTRNKKPVATATSPSPLLQANDSNSCSSSNEFKTEADESASASVRGRISTMQKSETFKQSWTDEEQKRLDDLLRKYPEEDVEARRWEKISKALGNRTPQQVASRVQKLFIKYAREGIPVPGRTPHVNSYGRRPGVHRHQRHNRLLFKRSTFLASHEPPVFMSEHDDDSNTNYSVDFSMDYDQRTTADEEDEECIPPHLRHTAEYQQLMYYKRLKKAKGHNKRQGSAQQQDYKCAKCSCEPTPGRQWWHCIDCLPNDALYLCDACSNCNFETLTHIAGHRLKPVSETQSSFVDGDYTQFGSSNYNYLDPNYMPAN